MTLLAGCTATDVDSDGTFYRCVGVGTHTLHTWRIDDDGPICPVTNTDRSLVCLKDKGHKGKHRFEARKSRAELKKEVRALNQKVTDLEAQVRNVSARADACMRGMDELAVRIAEARRGVIVAQARS